MRVEVDSVGGTTINVFINVYDDVERKFKKPDSETLKDLLVMYFFRSLIIFRDEGRKGMEIC